jgi:Ca2+-binding RTX toxin-like protein
MTTTVFDVNSVGAGVRHTIAANSDGVVVLSGVTVGSTTSAVFSGLQFNNLLFQIFGTVFTVGNIAFNGQSSSIFIAEEGSFISNGLSSSDTAIYLDGANNSLTNYGTITAGRQIGLLSAGTSTISNFGSINGSSGVFIGLFSGSNDHFVNGGVVTASQHDDLVRDTRYNNAVYAEGFNTRITNLSTGTFSAVSTEGSGVRFGITAGGSALLNQGSISSSQDWGVNLGTVSLGEALIRVTNFGTIAGGDGSYFGSVNNDTLKNRGLLDGTVNMGNGADIFDNRNGTVDGDVLMGAGADVFQGSAGNVFGTVFGEAGNDTFLVGVGTDNFNGGADVDTLDFSRTSATQLSLDPAISLSSASADYFVGFENVIGSEFNDIFIGNNAANQLFGQAADDILMGGGGTDTLRGGFGIDRLTGGNGNDRYRFWSLLEFGDIITDFGNGAGNNDAFTFLASGIGGGLIAGTLAANQFQIRADNVAQDGDDRFIYQTSDYSLWFDVDGNGSELAIMVADINSGVVLSNLDILLV